jgi:hydroxymethylglutaryl-CoA lyase
MTRSTSTVVVRDVTLRDGLQDESPLDTYHKLRIYEALLAAGVVDLELTSFVRADRVPALADAEQLVARTADNPHVTRWGLVLNERGAQRAVAAGIDHLQFVFSVSEPHNRANAGCSVDESVERLRSVRDSIDTSVALEVTMATAFGCPYAGPVDAGRVVDLAKRVVELGIDGLSLADTIGTAAPSEVRRLVSLVRDDIGELSLGVHLHDTRGLALANALTAIEAGITRVDASLGGLGGCPFAPGASGNLPIEDLVHALDAEGIASGIDVDRLIDASRTACSAVGRAVGSHVGIAGPRFENLAPFDTPEQ